MDLDPLSIVAPARVKVLLVPVGHVRRSRFSSFVERLQHVNVVRLGDVSPDTAIASVLSELGYHRKKALVLKELTAGLLPALVQARKDGAAEMGVHPAASLATLNATVRAIPVESASASREDSEEGVQHLLWLVCQGYGITSQKSIIGPVPNPATTMETKADDSSTFVTSHTAEEIVARVLKQASSKVRGSQDLKIDILRSCISLCEALPDLGGALRYSAQLLWIGGSGIAPGPDSSDGLPEIPIEEQVRLANNISRTLSAARQLGLSHPEADYWDDFLVRGIDSVDNSPSRRMLSHAISELEIAETIEAKKEKNPFIYNPFLKAKPPITTEPLLIAREEALFRVTMQNLYDFDVVIEYVKLDSDGVTFESSPQATSVGPYRTQSILLSGTPQAAGSLSIVGCTAKVRGCRERSFPIFREPWSLKPDVKGRHLQLEVQAQPASNASELSKGKGRRTPLGPVASTLALNVLDAQPNIVVKSISVPQSALMLLQGEMKTFKVTLQNTSHTVPVDLLLVAFDDSTISRRQSALTSKELSTLELYELELESAHKPSFRWLRDTSDVDFEIRPGGKTHIEIEVLGKPGLSYGTVQVDYCHLGVSRKDVKDRFYTRQLVIPLTVTVHACIDLIRNEFVTLNGGLLPPKRLAQPQDGAESSDSVPTNPTLNGATLLEDHLQSLLDRTSSFSRSRPYCLLLLDFRNSWANTITITVSLSDSTVSQQPYTHIQTINPGTTQRIVLPIPRVYLSNIHAPIPSLNPANRRQFVVTATKSSPEAERAMREAFWYRESLLSRLNATWEDKETGRSGNIELRGLQLTPHMLSAFKLEDLDISFSINSAEPNATVEQTSPSTYTTPTTLFLTLVTTLHNRSATPIRPLLRLQPTLANQPPNVALDLTRKLLVNGVLQRALPTLEPGETREVETGFIVLCSGVYEWGAIVEEVSAGKERNENERARAATGEMDMDLLGERGRRIWHAEEVCTVLAHDSSTEGDKEEAVEVE
ncbi:trafficking protein particle complex subunit 9, partial [Lecanoromycetidae sp. Uapishka_2]